MACRKSLQLLFFHVFFLVSGQKAILDKTVVNDGHNFRLSCNVDDAGFEGEVNVDTWIMSRFVASDVTEKVLYMKTPSSLRMSGDNRTSVQSNTNSGKENVFATMYGAVCSDVGIYSCLISGTASDGKKVEIWRTQNLTVTTQEDTNCTLTATTVSVKKQNPSDAATSKPGENQGSSFALSGLLLSLGLALAASTRPM